MTEKTTKTTARDRAKLQRYVERIQDALQRGLRAELDLYRICYDLEQDGVWRIEGFRLFPQWLRNVGVNASAYQSYRDARDLLGEASIEDIGLAAAQEIARIVALAAGENKTPLYRTRIAKKIYDTAIIKVRGFRTANGHEPSSTYVRQLIREAAEAAHMKLPEKESRTQTQVRERYQIAVAALRQIVELGDARNVEHRIAVKTLQDLGEIATQDAAA
jgi:hypothetical protein